MKPTSAVAVVAILAPVVLAPVPAAAPVPVIESVSSTELPRSGRFRIFGVGFGATQGASSVEIDGRSLPATTWSDTEIHAYVLGDAPLGPFSLRVVAGGVASNVVAVQVLPIEVVGPHVQWRFRADSAFILHRPAVGSDGTVYVNDVGGFLYAIDRGGGLKWIFDTQGQGASGPVAIGPGDRVYVASNPLGPELRIYALNPDGTQRWVFSDPDAQETIAGPNVGPDGNVYAVHDFGLGALSLTPDGQLRWSEPGFSDFGQSGTEVVFGPPGQLYFCARGSFTAFGLDGNPQWLIDVGDSSEQVAVGPDGSVFVEVFVTGAGIRLRSFDAGGSLRWTFFESPTNVISAPDVGLDGVLYIVRNTFEVHAINNDGTSRWVHADENDLGPVTASESPYTGPVVSPDNSTLLVAGVRTLGGPGIVEAMAAASGGPLWSVQLPLENGGRVTPAARPFFAPDGSAAYIGTSIPGQDPANEYSYLYAFQVGALCPADLDGDGDVDVDDFRAFLAAFAAGDPAADINGDGKVDARDFFGFLVAFRSGCS
ncbi:MAG: GC-type dockerin domain-anchored protein [Acidobacteriota bacterium]